MPTAARARRAIYAQLSGTMVDQDHFDLSSDFRAGDPGNMLGYMANFPYENGGNRDHSGFEDWRINAKVGITPNATDEYSINYTDQQADKQAPLSTDRQIVQGYFRQQSPVLGLAALGSSRRCRGCRRRSSATRPTSRRMPTTTPSTTSSTSIDDSRLFDSSCRTARTDDHSVGGFVEVGTDLIPMNTLKGAVHYRRDVHWEQALNYQRRRRLVTGYGALQEAASRKPGRSPSRTPSMRRASSISSTGVSYDMNEVLAGRRDVRGTAAT